MKIKFALFDMDGTIINSLFFWKEKWAEVGERYLHIKNYAPPAELDHAVRTTPAAGCAALIKKRFGLSVEEKELTAFVLGSILDFYKNRTNVKPGMEALLADFQRRGIRMCLATATDRDIAVVVMEHFGLSKYFEGVVSCADADVGVGKDSPKVYEKALNLLGAKPEETILFEDSHTALLTAKSFGLSTVGIEDPNNYNLDKLPEVSDIFIRGEENIFDSFQRQLAEKDFRI